MEGKLTIEPVVKRKLCTGCGTCAGICPREAIEMVANRRRGCSLPRIDKKRCIRCGLCHQACPGHGIDFESFNDALFGEIPEDIALGRYLGCYAGHTLEENARCDCSSRGLVNSLLTFALEENLIDGALVTRMVGDNPPGPEAFIARTRDGILSPVGSMSEPVAAADSALGEILRTDGRYAVVGLPCHIQGLRKAERHIAGLSERIRYRIGMPCGLNSGLCGGGRTGRKPPRRCTLCSDMLGELSDLTCGDVPAPEGVRAGEAQDCFVISRTTEAEGLLEAAASKEAIHLSELEVRELPISRDRVLHAKRKLQARIELLRWAGRSVPLYRQRQMTLAQGDCVDAVKSQATRRARDGRIIGGLYRLAGSLRRS